MVGLTLFLLGGLAFFLLLIWIDDYATRPRSYASVTPSFPLRADITPPRTRTSARPNGEDVESPPTLLHLDVSSPMTLDLLSIVARDMLNLPNAGSDLFP